jgi:CRP-like cAMP-binding protein
MCASRPRLSEFLEPFPDRPEAADVLESCPLCAGLPREVTQTLLTESHLAYVERGDTIWLAGTQARFFAVMGSGIVRMTRKSLPGRDVTVEILGPGACAGILAVISDTTYPLSTVAVTNAWYLKVANDVWRKAVQMHPKLRDRTILELGTRFVNALDFMALMLSGNVEQRLALALLGVCDLVGTNAPITRQCLADMACTTVESTIRVTSRWQKQGWISTGHRSITVLQDESLRQVLRQSPPKRSF